MLWVLKRTFDDRDGSFDHPKQMLKLMNKKILNFYAQICFSRIRIFQVPTTYVLVEKGSTLFSKQDVYRFSMIIKVT